MASTTVTQALANAMARGLALLDAQVLLSHCLGCRRGWLLAHDEATLDDTQRVRFASLVRRRSEGEPLAYLSGAKEFHHLRLLVDPRVLIPRPETEHLVDWGLEILRQWPSHRPPPRVIDLGTGSGAIALAIKSAHLAAIVAAADVSPEAIQVANANARRLALDVSIGVGDWWSAVADQRFDLALCNPPYIAAADPHLQALEYEPSSALTTGGDGLEALAAVIQEAPSHLQPGGWLLLEHGFDQADAVRRRMQLQGFTDVQTRRDLAGLERCTGARLAGE